MNKTITFFFLLLIISNFTLTGQLNEGLSFNIENNKPVDDSFDVNFQIEKSSSDTYTLAIALELEGENFVISPFSKDGVYGPFEISLTENRHLTATGKLQEIPLSIEEHDPIINQPVRFIRQNTTFKQKLKLTSKHDFEVSGRVWFVLEPSCIPYEVDFQIYYSDGKMIIKKTKTAIAKEYKGK